MQHNPINRDLDLAIPPVAISCVRRTFDSSFLNEVANHPEVRPFLGGEGPLDLTAEVASIANFALVAEGGGYVCIRHEPGIYEVHSLFLPDKRGHTLQAMRDGLSYMFSSTDCIRLVSQVPDDNAGAAAMAKRAHFREMFRRDHAARGPTSFVGISIDDWAMSNADLKTDGEWFHRAVDAANTKMGWGLPDHADDDAHQYAVGAAVRMVIAGNPLKAVSFYNRWARFARYPLIELKSLNPLVFDFGEGVIAAFEGGVMELTLCR